MLRKHLKLFILVFIELMAITMIAASSVGDAAILHFSPEDFYDNVQGRDYISVNEEAVKFSYDPEAVVYDDEGRVLGEDLLTWKFSLGSGAYDFYADYKAEESNAYVELYSESWVTDPISEQLYVDAGKSRVNTKLYVPFGRSMHDIQINVHYTGPGALEIYGISLTEDTSYRWVPVVGYILLFAFLDVVLFILFARSGAGARNYLREQWQIPALLVIAFLASLPAFTNFIYIGHDIRFHLARIIAVSREIGYGQFPVRMLTDMLQGYSYPTSTFYCDLFIYPFALLYYFGLPLYMCWNLHTIMLNAATTWIAYISFKRISGNRGIGVTGSALYTLSAYRIEDIYLRSSMGEFTALTFIPLVILGIWIIYYESEEDMAGWLYLGIGMTAIALSHLLSLEMISGFLVIFCLIEYKRTFTRYRIASIVKAAIMTVLLSCWFIFPMLMSMQGISLSLYDHQKYIQMSGAYPSQIFNLFLQGTGFSSVGTYDEMPLSIGGGMLVALAMLLYRIMKKDCGDRHMQKTGIILSVLSILISMYFFPWDSIASITEGRIDIISNIVRVVQFPWRYLEITTALLTVTAVCGLKSMEKEMPNNKADFRLWTLLLLMGTVISLGSFYVHAVNEMKWTRAADEEYIDNSIAFEEYLPGDSGRVADLPHEVEVAERDDIEVLSYKMVDGERLLTLENHGGEASVLIPVFAYPGYHAEDVDTHREVAIAHGEKARIELSVPAGYCGTVKVYYKEPVLWRLFEWISLASLVGLIVYIIYRGKDDL